MRTTIKETTTTNIIAFRKDKRTTLTILLNLQQNLPLFTRYKAAPGTTVTFDLYDIALIYHNLPLTPQHYIINF